MITQDDPRPEARNFIDSKASQLYLVYKQDSSLFSLALSSIREVLPMEELTITDVPNTDNSVLGLFNLRGEILPIIDFGVMVGSTATDIHSKTCRVIVINVQGPRKQTKSFKYGLAISEVLTVSELWLDEIISAQEVGSALTPILQGVYEWQDRLLMLLDAEAMMNAFKHH